MPPGNITTKLFINYRREDTAPYAGRLYDRLTAHFGQDQVFIDIDQIDPGEDFVEVIHRKVGSCEIAIVAIGPNWLTAKDASGQRRLDDAEDFVRVEITAALDRKIRVIPVLVGGARMPRRQDLPEALAPLSRRNAIELSETRFHADVSRLIEAIEKPRSLPEKKTEPPPEPVALIAEPAPCEKMADRENFPETSALRPRAEPTPVPAALTTETAPTARLPDPETSQKISAPRPTAMQDRPPNQTPVPRSQARATATKGTYLPWILLVLGCFVSFAVIFGGIFGYRLMNVLNRGASLGYNGGILWYTSSVTEGEAKKLGEYLVECQFFDGGPKGAQLKKTGSTYEFHALIKEGTENEDSVISYHKNLGHVVSLNVFNGSPVVVHLCDDYMKTLRVIPP